MIQLQMLNYIIKSKNKRLMSIYDENYFPMYLKEYNFIKNHLNKYKTIPDIDTVQESFPNFNVLDVKESEKYLQDKLFEDYSYNRAAEIINNSNKLFRAFKSINKNLFFEQDGVMSYT